MMQQNSGEDPEFKKWLERYGMFTTCPCNRETVEQQVQSCCQPDECQLYPRKFREQARVWGYSPRVGCMISSLGNPCTGQDIRKRSCLGVAEFLLQKVDPQSCELVLREYLLLELKNRGIPWRFLPINLQIKLDTKPTQSVEVPEIPAGVSVENIADLSRCISLDRGLQRLYRSLGRDKVPNREILVAAGFSDDQLIRILLFSENPLQVLMNSEISAQNSKIYQLLRKEIHEELRTLARRSVDIDSRQGVDRYFENSPTTADFQTVKNLKPHGILNTQFLFESNC